MNKHICPCCKSRFLQHNIIESEDAVLYMCDCNFQMFWPKDKSAVKTDTWQQEEDDFFEPTEEEQIISSVKICPQKINELVAKGFDKEKILALVFRDVLWVDNKYLIRFNYDGTSHLWP
jgi:hypothetical protein